MKQQLLLIFCSFSFLCGSAQETIKIDYDIKKLEGTWVATSDNKSYEINFVKESLIEKHSKTSFEIVLGSIKYLENNKVIKVVDRNGLKSPLCVFYRDDNYKFTVHYREKDNEKTIDGRVYFDINTDGKTARWYNLYDVNSWSDEPKKEKFDIPKELTFTKK